MVLTAALVLGVLAQGAQVQTPAPPPPATTASLAQAYFEFLQGRKLEGEKNIDGAIAAYQRALVAAPQSADVHAEIAGLFARAGRLADATDAANAALKIDPKNHEANRILGLVDSALTDTAQPARQAALASEAISHLEVARAGDVSRDLTVELNLGQLYIDTNAFTKAIEVLKDFLLDQPDYPDALILLSEAYDATHQVVPTIETLEDLVVAAPTLTSAETRLAELYQAVGRWSDAAARWETLAKQTPNNARLFNLRRATALVSAGDVTAGRLALQQLTKDSPNDVSLWSLVAELERHAGNAAAIEDAARHIAGIDPKDPRGPLAMADAKVAQHDYRGAVTLLDPVYTALASSTPPDASLPAVGTALSADLEGAGDKARAIQVLEDLHRRLPDDVTVTLELSDAYERNGKLDAAETLLRSVVAKDPSQAIALNSLGYLLADHGKKLDEAVGLIQRALAIETDNPSYLDSLGWAYFKQGKFTDAVPPLELAAGALKRSSAIQAHLGEVYFQLKRYADAANAWTQALGGDQDGIDVAAVTKKRDRAKELAK